MVDLSIAMLVYQAGYHIRRIENARGDDVEVPQRCTQRASKDSIRHFCWREEACRCWDMVTSRRTSTPAGVPYLIHVCVCVHFSLCFEHVWTLRRAQELFSELFFSSPCFFFPFRSRLRQAVGEEGAPKKKSRQAAKDEAPDFFARCKWSPMEKWMWSCYMGMSENGAYPQWNSHLVGIMIINHWV